MAFRCHISDRDLLNVLSGLRRDNVTVYPSSFPGTDGVVTALAPSTLSSASSNFKTGWTGSTAVPVGTIVNIVSQGFYFVTALTNSPVTDLAIATDATKQNVINALTVGTAKRFVIGGWSERIRVAYEELYRSAGQVKITTDAFSRAFIPDGDSTYLGQYVDKALYVPDTWHGADTALLYMALESVILNTSNWRDSVYEYWLEEVKQRKTIALAVLEWAFDYDEDDEVDTLENFKQTRLVR